MIYAMKKQLVISLTSISLLMTACMDLNEGMNEGVSSTIPVNVDGGIHQTQTRATVDGFVHGDVVGIYVVNYLEDNETAGTLQDSGNQADYVRYTYSESEHKWNPSKKVYYKDEQTHADIYGYYPYMRPDKVEGYVFEVQKDQSAPAQGDELSGYEASDFLWGKAENVAPTSSKVRINYTHRMACANVVLEEGTGFVSGEFGLLDKSVLVMNTTRKAGIDFSTGSVTAIGGAAADGIVMMPCSDGFRAIVVPQKIEAFKPLFAITIGGQTYNFKKDEVLEYPARQISRFTITVNKKSETGEYEFVLSDSQILAWTEDSETHKGDARQYYVVNMSEPGSLGAYLKAAKMNPNKIRNIKLVGKIDARDFFFMRDSMAVLQAVNLKETRIDGVKIKTNQYLENEIPDDAFYRKKTLVSFSFPEHITRIGSEAFAENGLLSGALIIPDDVKIIGSSAFSQCSNLASLTLPLALEEIGECAFYLCTSISGGLLLPNSLKVIGKSAYDYCHSITGSLVLPENLEVLGALAFSSCSGFSGDLRIPEKLKVLYEGAFLNCSGFRGQLKMHDDLRLEGPRIFSGCKFTGELKLPRTLRTIPADAFNGCLFSSIFEFPETLAEIGDNAFWNCWRLSGILKFPDSVVSVGKRAFQGCRTLEGIELPAELGVLKDNVFNGCSYISSIKCMAIEPPSVLSGAFSGVPKNNFTIEVPEQSVNRYQSDKSWGEFKRISANRNFSISRRIVRTLNAGCSKTFTVRALAGNSWSVESKPDWVEVSPSSGTGKVEVKLTVSELAKGSQKRAGEVVFLLDGKDYRAKTTVEQYNYQYGDGDVVTLQTATVGKGVNVVLVGDCYDAADISSGIYLKDIKEAYGYLFDVEPYKTYKDYFNAYAVFGLSDDSGIGTTNVIREAKFGSQYQIAEGLAPDEKTCFEYACKAPIDNDISHTLIVLIPNTTEYGGITYLWGDGSAIALCPKSSDAYPYDFRGIVQHEACGHGFGKLADEYIHTNAFINSCGCSDKHVSEFMAFKNLGWYRNLSLSGNMKDVDWSHFIFDPKYSNIVDVYEGGFYHTRGVYRSEPNSCMNNNIPYFSAISRQAIVERIKEYAGETFSLDEFYEKDVLTMTGSSTTKSSSVVFPQYPVRGGRQHAPKYMGHSPQF